MTDDPKVGVEAPEGAEVSPKSSPPIEAQATPKPDLLEEFAKFQKEVLSEVRGLQSRQDKADNKLQRVLEEYDKNVASGMPKDEARVQAEKVIEASDAEAKRNALIDKLLQRELNPSPGNGATDVAKVISDYKLDGNDPAVAPLYSLQGDALKAAAADLAYRRATKQPLSPSSAPVINETPAPPEGDVELLEQIADAQRMGDFGRLTALEARAKERGLIQEQKLVPYR